MPLTKAQIQTRLKELALRMEGWVRYEQDGGMVPIPKKEIDRTRLEIYELSEEVVLWT